MLLLQQWLSSRSQWQYQVSFFVCFVRKRCNVGWVYLLHDVRKEALHKEGEVAGENQKVTSVAALFFRIQNVRFAS
jgi:hypothetical protein